MGCWAVGVCTGFVGAGRSPSRSPHSRPQFDRSDTQGSHGRSRGPGASGDAPTSPAAPDFRGGVVPSRVMSDTKVLISKLHSMGSATTRSFSSVRVLTHSPRSLAVLAHISHLLHTPLPLPHCRDVLGVCVALCQIHVNVACSCLKPQPATEGFEDKLGALPLRRKALIAMGVQAKYGSS